LKEIGIERKDKGNIQVKNKINAQRAIIKAKECLRIAGGEKWNLFQGRDIILKPKDRPLLANLLLRMMVGCTVGTKSIFSASFNVILKHLQFSWETSYSVYSKFKKKKKNYFGCSKYDKKNFTVFLSLFLATTIT
jgi:hypothetical protein